MPAYPHSHAQPVLERPVRKLGLAEEPVARNGCKVLVVDDDQDNREILVALLDSEGYSAVGAENGSRALTALEEGLDPDLILTDLQMPVMSGWDLCESLKRDPSLRSIPVVLLCAMAAKERGKLQVDDAFEKPTDTTLLLSRIAELCGL
jgi:CheY-like chemotaxis protein